MVNTKTIYQQRFPQSVLVSRRQLWSILCRELFQKHVQISDTVMDIGAGYCDFINAIQCNKKIAVDINSDTKYMANRGVYVILKEAVAIDKKYDNCVDVVFMSNFLEHLPNTESVLTVLKRSRKLLKRNGTLIILQPNISLVGNRYWDFIDHHTALNGNSVKEALRMTGFECTEYVERCLPYTTTGILPTSNWLVWMYLHIPPVFRPFAGQSLFIAKRRA